MSLRPIAGRQDEWRVLEQALKSKSAEFIALYGRRRVGKTHLIRQFFTNKGVFLEITGVHDGNMTEQLQVFHRAMQGTFGGGLTLTPPKSWDQAFSMITKELKQLPKSKKLVVFLDELPWLATRRSGCLRQLDHYWNAHWSRYTNIVLIVCGSAASWMLDKIIHDKGGLHNRITRTLRLNPLTVRETAEYLKLKKNITWELTGILDVFTVMGGIPFYLERLEKQYSTAQNIDRLCFRPNGILYDEFSKLYSSLFINSEVHVRLLQELGKHRYGLAGNELAARVKLSSGGRIYRKLHELEESGFIAGFTPYGSNEKKFYRIIDEFTWFYLNWMEKAPRGPLHLNLKDYWPKQLKTPAWHGWRGYAFELCCLKHVPSIAKALEIDSMNYRAATWRYVSRKHAPSNRGAQVDLLFDREDNVITLLEIKHSHKPFTIDKDYALNLLNKLETFRTHTKTKKELQLVFLTTNGLKPNAWSEELVTQALSLEALMLE